MFIELPLSTQPRANQDKAEMKEMRSCSPGAGVWGGWGVCVDSCLKLSSTPIPHLDISHLYTFLGLHSPPSPCNFALLHTHTHKHTHRLQHFTKTPFSTHLFPVMFLDPVHSVSSRLTNPCMLQAELDDFPPNAFVFFSYYTSYMAFSSVQFSRSVVSDSL